MAYWLTGRMDRDRENRINWLKSEVDYIRGMFHRALRRPPGPSDAVLQIGSGPVDVIDFWPGDKLVALDPLAEQYKRLFASLRNPDVTYVQGFGESLPFEDNSFDFVIIRNAIDHVVDPGKTLNEIGRVLKPTGAVYIWVYVYSRYGSAMLRLINFLTKYFDEEPWGFTKNRLMRLLRKTGFHTVLPAVEDRPKYPPGRPTGSTRSGNGCE